MCGSEIDVTDKEEEEDESLSSEEEPQETKTERELKAIRRAFISQCSRIMLDKFVEAGFSDEEELAKEILENVCSEFKALKEH